MSAVSRQSGAGANRLRSRNPYINEATAWVTPEEILSVGEKKVLAFEIPIAGL